MLQEMMIQDFAIISTLSLSFGEGMTVLTGETGAGKSIIIDALSLLAGSRGSVEYIRGGKDKAVIQGLFQLPENEGKLPLILQENGIVNAEDGIILQREINSNGKSVCRVNGQLTTLSVLKKIGGELVDIQGQHDHQELMDVEKHIDLLDAFGDEEFLTLKNEYQVSYQEYAKSLSIYKVRRKNEMEFEKQKDMLLFQTQEIEEAKLEIGEEEKLEEELQLLSNYQEIQEGLNLSNVLLLDDDSSILSNLSKVIKEMEGLSGYSSQYEAYLEIAQSAHSILHDLASDVSRDVDNLDFDAERLLYVEERLALLQKLKKKYGEDVSSILSYYDTIKAQLDEYSGEFGNIEDIENKAKQQRLQTWNLGLKLREARKQLAQRLERQILQELADLYIDKADFRVQFQEHEKLRVGEEGIEEIEFYISTNPGEPLKPLVKVASGGEMSRLLLALKTIFTKNKRKTSIVFDEVDAGVSGRVAQAIAEKIYEISETNQVLCITHLPQVAARSDAHFLISKQVEDGRTETKVTKVESEERVREIARMFSGEKLTDVSIQHAKELMEKRE